MRTRIAIFAAFLLIGAAAARAEDAYFDIPVSDLKLVEGELPKSADEVNSFYPHSSYEREQTMQPYAMLDGTGEAYFTGGGAWRSGASNLRIHIRAPEGQEIKGRLALANEGHSGMAIVRFVVPAKSAAAAAKTAFNQAKVDHYANFVNRDLPGGAWFRHQYRLASNGTNSVPAAWPGRTTPQPFRIEDLSQTYDLFTGGRAISENLQLDRAMPPRATNETPVKVDSITGITIKEIDWKPYLKDAKPELDPLAGKIPFDQYAVFFPSFQAALAVSDETKQHDTPVLRLAQPRAEDAGVVERYQRQLGLPLSTLARVLGPTLVKSVAMTGTDVSFPLGADVAVLLESPQPIALSNLLAGRIAIAAAEIGDVQPVNGTIGGLKYRGFLSPDRKMSSYLVQLEDAVIVTNSTYQLERLAAVRQGKAKSLADLDEFKFFRNRYRRGDADESALVFISDPTIRRLCGPKWRIADSRRTRARAVMAELQASQVKPASGGKPLFAEPGLIHTDLPIEGGGEIRLTRGGVVSSVYGTLDFMTPIGELALDEVTKTEADTYSFWRDGYQRNWTWAFDPIGLRIGLNKEKLAADLTIMPLIANTEYSRFFEISKGAAFEPTAGDPHKALAQLVFALNRDSLLFRQGEGLLLMAAAGQKFALGWVGSSLSVYADDDPFWNDLAKVEVKKLDEFLQKNIARLPVAVRIESKSPLQLAAFLATLRGYIEQTGPGLTRWDTLKYNEQGYVRVAAVKGQNTPSEIENLAIYYTTAGGALTVTLNEDMLKRAIDRAADRQPSPATETAKPKEKPLPVPPPWLGSNVALHVDRRILEVANDLGRDQYHDRMQILSWNNLPILNEWKRLFPDRDPVAVHRELWGVTLVCPGGGKYVWNADYGTMESTVYGHPGQPKAGPAAPPVLSTFPAADFGLTLENDGLRARVELHRPAK